MAKKSKVKPITPNEIDGLTEVIIPDGVIEAFNETIVKHWKDSSSCFLQKEVLKVITKKTGIKSADILGNGFLDVEPIFEQAGWKVEYDAPAWNGSGEPSFTFSKKDKK